MAKKALTLCLVIAVLMPATALAGEKHRKNQAQRARKVPKKKRAHLDTKGAVRGSGFRISWIHRMRGNFAEYDKLDIVKVTSAIGNHVGAKAMEKYTEDLAHSFEATGIFKQVRIVDEAKLAGPPVEPTRRTSARAAVTITSRGVPASVDSSPPGRPGASVRAGLDAPLQVIPADAPLPQPAAEPIQRSPLEAPLMAVDPASLPQENEAVAVTGEAKPKRTMIITGKVIYYKKGNRGLRALGIGAGYSRFVVRFHIYDKELGQELGMGNISGEASGGFLSVPGLASNAEGRKQAVVALVNRVEVRRAKADQ